LKRRNAADLKMKPLSELIPEYKPKEPIKDERKALLKELQDRTGYKIGHLLYRLKGMQTPRDLRFILSAMNAARGDDDRHRFNIVMFNK